jgi:membrane protein implicated in regulation of membrane protease activity
MVESLLADFSFWHWFTLAAILIILEIFSPGAFFLWLGIAAVGVGVVMVFLPEISWQSQLTIYAFFSIASLIAWRYSLKFFSARQQTTAPNLNRRAEQYVGRTFTLVEPIVNGVGKIHVDDSTWRVRGEDSPVGSKVRVTGVDGILLEVESI